MHLYVIKYPSYSKDVSNFHSLADEVKIAMHPTSLRDTRHFRICYVPIQFPLTRQGMLFCTYERRDVQDVLSVPVRLLIISIYML